MSMPAETARLSFRAWRLDDVEEFHAICSDRNVMQFVGDGQPWSRQKTQDFIERASAMLAEHGFCRWPLIHKEESKLIGFCGFAKTEAGPEIGWRLARPYWQQGLATEAARAVLAHGFSPLGFQNVLATVQSENTASIRIIQKLGMTHLQSYCRDGRDVQVFRLTAPSTESS